MLAPIKCKHCFRPGALRPGFSLVELVIVVVIIGIIAAIAVPRISRGAKGACEGAVNGNLAALRSAIDFYAAEHNGAFPGLHKNDGSEKDDGKEADFIAQLTEYSAVNGKTGAPDPAATPPLIYGPYLRNGVPPLSVGVNAGSTEIKFDGNSPPETKEGGGHGWMYNPETGEIIANTTATDESGKPYSEY